MRWGSWLLVIAVCLAVTGGLVYYKYTEIQAAIAMGKAFPEPLEAVEVYVVKAIPRTPSLTVTGEVVARQSAQLRNELAGRIVNVGFAPGARVVSGEVLVQLDVSQERAQLAEAQADQQIAQLAYDRAQRLVRSGAGSVEARDQAQAQKEAAQARVNGLRAMIDKKTLRAPFDAITGLHQLEAGQFLDAGTAITQLIGVAEHVWIDFAIPQEALEGERTQVTVGSDVMVALGDSGGSVRAKIIARDAAVSNRSRNLRMRAQVAMSELPALPGMLVRIVVPLGDEVMAMVVPPTAVRRDAFGASVYVLESTGDEVRARKRQIELGSIGDIDQAQDWVVVTRGVKPGDEIAAIGAFKLRDGSLVAKGPPNEDAANRLVGH